MAGAFSEFVEVQWIDTSKDARFTVSERDGLIDAPLL